MARRCNHKPLTDEERDARRQADRDRIEQAARALLTSDGWQRWIKVRASNGLSRYSLGNQMLIAIGCYSRGITPTYVAGFRAFLDLNRCVRKGETAIRILAPVAVKQRDEHGEETGEKKVFFRTVPVFDTLSRVRWWARNLRYCLLPRRDRRARCWCCPAVARVRSRVAATSPCHGARTVREGPVATACGHVGLDQIDGLPAGRSSSC
jgi:hypothetical protein